MAAAPWGADVAEAFVEAEQEFRTGDHIQFTRSNRQAHRINGHVASVVAVDPQRGSITVEPERGACQTLDLAHLADRHIPAGVNAGGIPGQRGGVKAGQC